METESRAELDKIIPKDYLHYYNNTSGHDSCQCHLFYNFYP